MAQVDLIKVEVVYAAPGSQRMIVVDVPAGSTIEYVIHKSGILDVFPEIDLARQKIGVFSKVRQLNDVVQAGDRIEIYRPLTIDPKDARRAKAKKAKKTT